MSTFQIIIVSLFVSFIVIGVGTFALFGGVFGSGGTGPVTIWGTMPQTTMDTMFETLRVADSSMEEVRYVEQEPDTYETTLLNAMASGNSPDLILLTQDQVGGFSDKLVTIPYSTVSQSQFVSSYIDEGQLFLTLEGSLALPFMVDPLVMYWNRELFASSGVATPPQYWNDFLTLAPKITSLDASQNLKRSAVAMGSWQNIRNAKAIVSTLFMQSGEFMTGRNATGALVPTFGQQQGAGENQAESALRFYTEFSNPGKTTYSWNRSLPRSDEAFAAGQVAVYFGFASEYAGIQSLNPNVRFAVAPMPQLQGTGARITYGAITGLSIPKSAPNIAGAAVVAQKLSSQEAAIVLLQATSMPSVRRDVFADTRSNAAAEVFAQSALIARGWIDPSPRETDIVFKTMVESVISGRQEPASAVAEAAQEFVRLVPIFY
jgi:ABC-type glycerol-3-phosphate transport system substrate-binding protein